jgi:hypothetical protein
MDGGDGGDGGGVPQSATLEQFRIPQLPPCVYYISDFISEVEERLILDKVASNDSPFLPSHPSIHPSIQISRPLGPRWPTTNLQRPDHALAYQMEAAYPSTSPSLAIRTHQGHVDGRTADAPVAG